MGFCTRGNHITGTVISFAQKAEDLGYDSLSVHDYIVFRTGWLDAISSLSAIAATTDRIKIRTSILNIVIRNPVICAKALHHEISYLHVDYL